jgi:ribosomal protein S27AE
MAAEDARSRPAEESSPEGMRAAAARDNPGPDTAGRTGAPAEGVLTLICFKCGTEYFFADESPPAGLTCEKCGNTVFRSFFSPQDDEVARDFRDSTARDLDPDDAEGDALPGDALDLNRD